MYPCDQCGFQGTDLDELKNHVEEYHQPNLYKKRIIKNLKNIDLDEDSDSDGDWTPRVDDDEKLLAEETDEVIPKKRKKNQPENVTNKKSKTEHVCSKCHKRNI